MQIAQISPGALVDLRGGIVGRYEGRCRLTERHRVTTYRSKLQNAWVHPKHIGDGRDVEFTVYLITDDGCCRGDKAESPLDFMSASL